jgi:hypothetical protein
VLLVNDLKPETAVNGNWQLLVLPTQQQSAIGRSEPGSAHVARSQAGIPLPARNAESRLSPAEGEADSVAGSEEITLHHSPLEVGANFGHTDYDGADKPSVSVEFAIGYAIAVFNAAQFATKSLASVGANIIHSPAFHAAYLNHDDEMERGEA